MIRTNSFTIKVISSLFLILLSILLFDLSYKEIRKINLGNYVGYEESNINYFDKKLFQKYYEKIEIQDLTEPLFDQEKSQNYFKDITFNNLFSIFQSKEEINERQNYNENNKEVIPFSTKIHNNYEKNDFIKGKIYNEKDPIPFKEIIVSKGDNFAKILKKGGLKGNDIDKIIINGNNIYDFSKIFMGDKLKIYSKYNNEKLSEFELLYKFSKTDELVVSFLEDNFLYEVKKIPTTKEEVFITGVIETSLYEAMKNQNLSELIITEIIRIYSFDIDFQRDIHQGDRFEILFTRKKNEKNETVEINDPEYLMLSSRGNPLTYYLFSNSEFSEYFDEYGKGMTKSLMKTPINGARLSSNYGMRKHPILGYNKMHKGVDFAAPTGTPIFSAGNGVIEYAGRNGGYGKYIRIRHDSTYKTAYAHLNNYNKGIGKGIRVKQGDIIGYVGSTGRSTGPHLHYEIIVNGKQINPSTLKLPSGRKLNNEQLNEFNLLVELKNREISNYKNPNKN